MFKKCLCSARALAAAAALAVLSVAGTTGYASPVTGDLVVDGNTAVTFDPATATPVTVRFTDPNIASNDFFQIRFRSNNTPFTIGAVKYSFDNITYASAPDFGTMGIAPTYAYSAPFETSQAHGTSIYLQYTLPAGLGYSQSISNSKYVQVQLLSNSDNYQVGGVLGDQLGLVQLSRLHKAIVAPVPEPASFAIASIGLGLAGAVRLRRRLAAAKA